MLFIYISMRIYAYARIDKHAHTQKHARMHTHSHSVGDPQLGLGYLPAFKNCRCPYGTSLQKLKASAMLLVLSSVVVGKSTMSLGDPHGSAALSSNLQLWCTIHIQAPFARAWMESRARQHDSKEFNLVLHKTCIYYPGTSKCATKCSDVQKNSDWVSPKCSLGVF